MRRALSFVFAAACLASASGEAGDGDGAGAGGDEDGGAHRASWSASPHAAPTATRAVGAHKDDGRNGEHDVGENGADASRSPAHASPTRSGGREGDEGES